MVVRDVVPAGNRPQRRHSGGFSILEVIIAMTVLALALLGLFSLHNLALGSNWYAVRMNTSSMLARQQMEFLMNVPLPAGGAVSPLLTDGGAANPTTATDPLAYLPLPNAGSAPDPINALGTADGADGPLIYYRTWDVENLPGLGTDVILLTVRVSFQDNAFGGRRSGVTISSMRYKDVEDYTAGGGP